MYSLNYLIQPASSTLCSQFHKQVISVPLFSEQSDVLSTQRGGDIRRKSTERKRRTAPTQGGGKFCRYLEVWCIAMSLRASCSTGQVSDCLLDDVRVRAILLQRGASHTHGYTLSHTRCQYTDHTEVRRQHQYRKVIWKENSVKVDYISGFVQLF